MEISKESLVQYTFTADEHARLEVLMQDDLLRAYLTSSFAQLREAMLDTVQSPVVHMGMNPEDRVDLVLAFIGGAKELFEQITRIGEN